MTDNKVDDEVKAGTVMKEILSSGIFNDGSPRPSESVLKGVCANVNRQALALVHKGIKPQAVYLGSLEYESIRLFPNDNFHFAGWDGGQEKFMGLDLFRVYANGHIRVV